VNFTSAAYCRLAVPSTAVALRTFFGVGIQMVDVVDPLVHWMTVRAFQGLTPPLRRLCRRPRSLLTIRWYCYDDPLLNPCGTFSCPQFQSWGPIMDKKWVITNKVGMEPAIPGRISIPCSLLMIRSPELKMVSGPFKLDGAIKQGVKNGISSVTIILIGANQTSTYYRQGC